MMKEGITVIKQGSLPEQTLTIKGSCYWCGSEVQGLAKYWRRDKADSFALSCNYKTDCPTDGCNRTIVGYPVMVRPGNPRLDLDRLK
ncbi:hypothetical protein D3C78_993850 [compost metagenome]